MQTQHVKIKANYVAVDGPHVDEEGEMVVSEAGLIDYFSKKDEWEHLEKVTIVEKKEDDMYGGGYAFIGECKDGNVLVGELYTHFFSETTGYHPPHEPDKYFNPDLPTCGCASCKMALAARTKKYSVA